MYEPDGHVRENIVLLQFNCVVSGLASTEIKSYFQKLLESVARLLESYFLRVQNQPACPHACVDERHAVYCCSSFKRPQIMLQTIR